MAQQNLKAVIMALMPLLPFASAESCGDVTGMLMTLLKEALDGQEALSQRATQLKRKRPRDLVAYLKAQLDVATTTTPTVPPANDEARTKRRKTVPPPPTTTVTMLTKLTTPPTMLSALDIWGKRGESVQMVAALSWWCETVAMWEAVRTLLALDGERTRVVWGSDVDERLLERWYRLYCNIPGVKMHPSKALFRSVVNSVTGGHKSMRVVWSGRSGEANCVAAECNDAECDGRHIGLRVQWDGKGSNVIRGQIGVSYNPKQLKRWAPKPGTPKHRDATARIELIQSFLRNSDNVFRVSRTKHILMVGLWGLVEHCCDSPSLGFAKEYALETSERGCNVQVLFGSSVCASTNGYGVWNYGNRFTEEVECKCLVCELTK